MLSDDRLAAIENHTDPPRANIGELTYDVFVLLVEVKASRNRERRLRERLEASQLRSIEARNPGIDMEQVKRERAGLLDDDTEADDGYVSLYDYHVNGCTFTTEDGWQCLPGCPSREATMMSVIVRAWAAVVRALWPVAVWLAPQTWVKKARLLHERRDTRT